MKDLQWIGLAWLVHCLKYEAQLKLNLGFAMLLQERIGHIKSEILWIKSADNVLMEVQDYKDWLLNQGYEIIGTEPLQARLNREGRSYVEVIVRKVK
ncbi:hypothetical protein ACR9PT_06210 [Piscirickettsia salmonis]|nr:hypothetical protein [Piscirickettsia salmonis]